jgi:hypothetical protein
MSPDSPLDAVALWSPVNFAVAPSPRKTPARKPWFLDRLLTNRSVVGYSVTAAVTARRSVATSAIRPAKEALPAGSSQRVNARRKTVRPDSVAKVAVVSSMPLARKAVAIAAARETVLRSSRS